MRAPPARARLSRRPGRRAEGAALNDVGNAFNDWNERSLKRGWGLGVRWYAIFGSVRLDFGRAEDIQGNPWEVYLTIGTQLL